MILKTNSQTNISYPAHFGDAGYDIIAASEPQIVGSEVTKNYFSRIDYIEYDTELVIAPELNVHTYIFPRSSISKTNLVLANSIGLVDNQYRGTLKLRFKYMVQPCDLTIMGSNIVSEINFGCIYKKGDKIGQLVFANTLNPQIQLVDSFEDTIRNNGGFGSTGA